jgi:hypothetical protein
MKETRLNKTKPCGASRLAKLRTPGRAFLAIALAVIAIHAACGANAYLPSVGPPALRFETKPDIAAPAKIFTPEMVTNNSPVAAVIEPTSTATNATPTMGSLITTNSSDKASSPNMFVPSISDAVITPQMFVDYLKPAAGGSSFVPIYIGFIPPAQTVVQPSRAVYKSQ